MPDQIVFESKARGYHTVDRLLVLLRNIRLAKKNTVAYYSTIAMKKKSLITFAPAEDNNIETWDEIVDFLGVNIKKRLSLFFMARAK